MVRKPVLIWLAQALIVFFAFGVAVNWAFALAMASEADSHVLRALFLNALILMFLVVCFRAVYKRRSWGAYAAAAPIAFSLLRNMTSAAQHAGPFLSRRALPRVDDER